MLRPHLFFAACTAGMIAGCGMHSAPPHPAAQLAELARTRQDQFANSLESTDYVGLICSGELLTRTFPFVNNSGETLKIASDSDITVGCGFTSLDPSRRLVEPGGQAQFVLTIRTERLDGKFRYASTVRWTGESGRVYPQRVIVQGEAAPIVTVSPDTLTFGPGEIGCNVGVSLCKVQWLRPCTQ